MGGTTSTVLSSYINKTDIIKKSLNKRTQIATLFLILIFNPPIAFIAYWLRFVEKDFLFSLMLPVYIGVGWLIGLFFTYTGRWFLSIFFPLLKIHDILKIISSDEIIGNFKFHQKFLNKLLIKKEAFFQFLEKYFSNTPYGDDVICELLKTFDQKNPEKSILEYMNFTENIVLIKNTDIHHIIGAKLENISLIQKYIFEIKQTDTIINSTESSIQDFLTKDYILNFFQKSKLVYSKTSHIASKYKDDLIKSKEIIETEFKISTSSYLNNVNSILNKKLEDQIEQEITDIQNQEILIRFTDNAVKTNKGRAFINIQIENRRNYKLIIDKINIVPSKNKSKYLSIKTFKFENHINSRSFLHFFVPIDIAISVVTEITINVAYSYRRGAKRQISKSKLIEFKKIPDFKPVKNPYSLQAVEQTNMFFGREREVDQIIGAINEDNYPVIITIIAYRRMGKTSLLKHLNRILKIDYRIFYLDAQFFDFHNSNLISFLEEILSFLEIDHSKELRISDFFEILAAKRAVILIDEFDVVLKKLGNENSIKLLQYIRDYKIKNQPVFILSIPTDIYKILDIEIQNILFSGLPVTLNPFDKISVIKLITNPVKNFIQYTPQSFLHIYRQCGGFPNLLQTYCFLLVNYNNRILNSAEIDFEDLAKFEGDNISRISNQISVLIESLPQNHKKILQILKLNNNKINQVEIITEIAKYYIIDNLQYELIYLISMNILEIVNNQYICTSKFILDQIN
ncbi:MAG: hypothetical protein HQ541_08145 [Mariniphaga sp.]|nr:hypothetical protein [Mariniphaga sp.]